MESQTEQSVGKLQISLPGKPCELRLWLVDQITVLGEAFGEELAAARLRLYAEDLADLDRVQLELAFVRARRECRFFPKIAELRELAGASAQDEGKVEAEAAWTWVNDYLRKWGVDRLPLYSRGERVDAPPLPARIDYAIRRIGGLRGLNQITEESRPFVFKDFCEAYKQAPIAEMMQPKLASAFGEEKLLGNTVKQLTGTVESRREQRSADEERHRPAFKAKAMPTPLTDAQLRDKRQILKQQAASLLEKKGAMNGGNR